MQYYHITPISWALFWSHYYGNLCPWGGEPSYLYSLVYSPFFLSDTTQFVLSSSSQLRNYTSNLWFSYGWQGDLGRAIEIQAEEATSWSFQESTLKGRFNWFKPFVLSKPSLLLGGSWRCSSHFVIMRQPARGWKLDYQKEGEHNVREIFSLMMASYLPALGCLLLDWRKRDPDLIKPPWLEFSVIFSWNHYWFMYQVSMDVTVNKKRERKSQSCIFSCILHFCFCFVFDGTFRPTTDWTLNLFEHVTPLLCGGEGHGT